ncbi:MAG TPA: GNAT family N-acetyltransferase [Candidatus Cryosericum sp.]|nr:GNAT family N-acetyltransferase [Candidatus Cryosericum sp.]
MTRRPATPNDVERMLALMAPHVAAGDLLPRTPEDVRERLHEFLLLEGNGTERRLVGVGALHRYDAEMAEIRSLAVDPGWTGQGCGRFLASGLIEKARAEGHERLIALTRRPAFFERLGFSRTHLDALPEKVTRDCILCPRRLCCDETAMLLRL